MAPTNSILSFHLTSFEMNNNYAKKLFSVLMFVTLSIISVFILQLQSVNAHSLMQQQRDGGGVLLHNNGGGEHQQHLQQQQQQHQSNKLMQTGHHGNQNRCQSGWMWFNNKCWVTTQSRRDFSHAMELCKKMYNSTLPTIHSEDENEFLRQNIDLHNSPIWLYARHNHQYNKTRWLDKSAVNYTRWDVGQPSDKSSLICIKTEESWYMKKAEPVDGQTECVSFWEDAKWGTQVGCLVLLPVVCEKKLTPISRISDGPNGTILSQFEQQQMFPSSGVQSSFNYNMYSFSSPVMYLITALTTTTILINQMTLKINQKETNLLSGR